MSFISRLQRRFGWLAIPHLAGALVAGQAALFVANLMPEGVRLDRLALDPARVVAGEWWRVITFLFAPPPSRSLLIAFYFMLMYLFGSTLERQWGAFRFTLYVLVGYLANVAAAFLAWAAGAPHPAQLAGDPNVSFAAGTNLFLYGSWFLAFARLYPDFIINLFFVLPIRIKWLALLAWLGYAVQLATGDWTSRLMVVATVLNYLLFFGREHWRDLRQKSRRRTFQAGAMRAAKPPKHACHACGLTSDAAPRTLFRYCSKCAGQVCYCPDHIRDHEHVTAEIPAQR